MPDEIVAGDAPAPAPEPVAPVVEAPVAPVETPAPTEQEAADAAEQSDWDRAAEEIFPGLKSTQKPKEEKKPDEPAKPEKTAEEIAADKKAAEDKKPDAKPGDGTDAGEAGTGEQPGDGDEEANGEADTSARDSRLAARESARQLEAVKTDVRKQMFADIPQTLQDADGDPINGIDDVIKLMNPRTNEAFTEEEAGMWLLNAQQKFNESLANTEKNIDTIADVNVDLKDQADSVSHKWGAILKEMPELRDELWAEYEKTLTKDEATGIITKAPVSLETFYDVALRPYATVAQKAESDAAAVAKTEADTKAAEEAKAAEAEAKAKKRADRSDVYGSGKVDDMDDEEKAWAKAAEAVFGPRKK